MYFRETIKGGGLAGCGRYVLGGAWRFALVSIAGFSVWAFAGKWFHTHGGDVALYAACAMVFMGAAGLLMYPLVIGSHPVPRFYAFFAPAFLIYCIVWSLSWFLLRFGAGEWLASLTGSLCFVSVCGWRLGNMRPVPGAVLFFFVAHSIGYFAGGKLMQLMLSSARTGMFNGLTKSQVVAIAELSWGLLYGLGFGAGLGYTLWVLQPALKDKAA